MHESRDNRPKRTVLNTRCLGGQLLVRQTMSVLTIENASRQLAKEIVDSFKNREGPTHVVDYDSQGNLLGHFEEAFSLQGLYGFCVTKGGRSAIAYIGKTESKGRLRQHLTGRNKDDRQLSSSVSNKHQRLKEAIARGFTIHLCIYSDNNFGKPSLSCLEIAAAIYSKSDCANIFPDFKQRWWSFFGHEIGSA